MKKYFKFSLLLILIYVAVGMVNLFLPAGIAFADGPTVTIDPVPTVNVYDESLQFFTVTARVSSSETLTGYDIEWLFNGVAITDPYKVTTPSSAPKTSVIKMYHVEFSSVSALDVWTFRARLRTQPTVYAEVSVTFKTSPSPLSVVPQTAIRQQYSPNELTPFVFGVEGLEEETSIQWYMLENTNKFIVAPGASTGRTYSYNPTSAGEFTFRAKVGNEISQAFKVIVEYVPITEIEFTVSLQLENSNGFNTYLFRITNLNSSNDITNVNWYIEGYSTPIQYGGTSFLFQPTAYGTYRIVARHGSVKSTTHTIDVKIDRTVEILIGSGVVVAIMGIGLIITIIKNIKSEKIW